MSSEFEKRAPGAVNFKRNWWRLPAAAAVIAAAVVYNENQPYDNNNWSPNVAKTLHLGKSPLFTGDFQLVHETPVEEIATPDPQTTAIEQKLEPAEPSGQSVAEIPQIPQEYTVKQGDFLSKIAQEVYGTEKFWPVLAHVNNINNPNILYAGTRLTLPAPEEAESIMESLPPITMPQLRIASATPGIDASIWDFLAQCESGGNWSADTGNRFYGGLQFTLESWQLAGGTGYPHEASREEQITRAQILLAIQGWSAWPACSRLLGLR